ncbi:MAG: transposase, partial [Actinomycetia bacterium]|nr:transposase [Actinomycetes bacterium]
MILKIKRAYKTELKPNKAQRRALSNHAGAARFAFNWGLARKTESSRLTGKSPSAMELHRELNSLKNTTYPWLYEVSKCAPQEALRDLDRAFSHFFRRCDQRKKGKHKGKVGFPRFKTRRRGLGSFRLTGSIHVEEGRVKLPHLGWIRLNEKGYLPVDGTEGVHVLSATVSCRAGKWFVSLQVEEEKPNAVASSGPPAGIDLGVKTLAACSYGGDEHVHYETPKALMRGARKLARLQKKLARQEKGSGRREETRKRIARQHMRISCVRSDAIHKATSQIVAKAKPPLERPYVIGVEDLNVSGMMKNHSLARSVADASMREFRRQLAYKCAWYGIELVVVPRFDDTSKLGSKCGGVKQALKLSDRTFICESCGHVADRDDNTSDNMRLLAVSSTERVNGGGGDVRPLDSERRTPGKRQSEEVA